MATVHCTNPFGRLILILLKTSSGFRLLYLINIGIRSSHSTISLPIAYINVGWIKRGNGTKSVPLLNYNEVKMFLLTNLANYNTNRELVRPMSRVFQKGKKSFNTGIRLSANKIVARCLKSASASLRDVIIL